MDSIAVGEDLDKDVIVDGEMVSKYLEAFAIEDYDINGNKVHYKNSNDIEKWYEYDSNGNMIHFKDNFSWEGREEWYDYDSNGNKIHSKDRDGDEWWYEYDSKGNEIYSEDSDGNEWWYEYDDKGNKIHYKASIGGGDEEWYDYVFWDNGKLKAKITYISHECNYDYDDDY